MSSIERFEDLISWQKARKLTTLVYSSFSSLKDFGFRDQITRASVSIMNNIAEGFGRYSTKDSVRFLVIAKGSLLEVKSMTYLASDLGYAPDSTLDIIQDLITEISKILQKQISSLNNSLQK